MRIKKAKKRKSPSLACKNPKQLMLALPLGYNDLLERARRMDDVVKTKTEEKEKQKKKKEKRKASKKVSRAHSWPHAGLATYGRKSKPPY
jgi:hypothetical protein